MGAVQANYTGQYPNLKFTLTNYLKPSQTIDVSTFHMSCKSSPLNRKTRYVGLIVYSIGTFPSKQKIGCNIYPGYLIIKDSSEIDKIQSRQGMIHGKFCKWFFGIQPNQLKKFQAVISGFSIDRRNTNTDTDFQFQKNSSTFNCLYSTFHNSQRSMSQKQEQTLKGFIKLNMKTKQQNISVSDVKKFIDGK